MVLAELGHDVEHGAGVGAAQRVFLEAGVPAPRDRLGDAVPGPRQGEDRRLRRGPAARALRRRRRRRLGRRGARRAHRRLPRDPDPLGDAADRRADRARREPEGDRPCGDRRGQRGRDRGDQARDHRRQRAAVEHRRGRRAHDRADARARAQRAAGARVADRASGSGRSSAAWRSTRRRSACSASAASASSSPHARKSFGMHIVAFDPFVGSERFRELGVEKAETPADLYARPTSSPPPAQDGRDARLARCRGVRPDARTACG